MKISNTSMSGAGGTGAGRSAEASAPEATNTLRISMADFKRLISEMEAGSGTHHGARLLVRWPFARHAVTVEIHQPGANSTRLHFACRNLSGEGIGLLHASFLHNGTRCTVYLPQLVGSVVPVEGKVMRCRHVKGLVHEIGVKFDKNINIRQFVLRDPTKGLFALETIDPTRLQGVVLHIDGSAMQRKLVRHYLRDTSLEIVNAESAQDGLDRVNEGFDLILAEYNLQGMAGPKLVEAIRAKGLQTSMVMLTSDSRQSYKNDKGESRANSYLQMPINQDQLLRGLAEFLLADETNPDAGGPVYSTLPSDHPSHQFVADFVDDAKRLVKNMKAAITEEDIEAVRRICDGVRNVAAEVGFAMISESAQGALTALDASMSVADSQRQLRSLLSMCMRAKAR